MVGTGERTIEGEMFFYHDSAERGCVRTRFDSFRVIRKTGEAEFILKCLDDREIYVRGRCRIFGCSLHNDDLRSALVK